MVNGKGHVSRHVNILRLLQQKVPITRGKIPSGIHEMVWSNFASETTSWGNNSDDIRSLEDSMFVWFVGQGTTKRETKRSFLKFLKYFSVKTRRDNFTGLWDAPNFQKKLILVLFHMQYKQIIYKTQKLGKLTENCWRLKNLIKNGDNRNSDYVVRLWRLSERNYFHCNCR